ncbi:hypothetical protein [Pseudoxanthomonas koreensis]|nr:hypothetical protein [Pseudoxanthomonas koreensis]
MSPDSYLARLERDFDAMFRLPPINPPDPLAEVEASEGIAAMESDDAE